jgi:hypothetical protein
LSSGIVISGNNLSLDLSILSPPGGEPAAVGWTISYPVSSITAISVAAGPSATAAGKSLSCSSSPGSYTCIASGMNARIIANGMLATVSATVSGLAAIDFGVGGTAAVANDGTALSVLGVGSVVVVNPPLVTVGSIGCNPTSLAPGGKAVCTATLIGLASLGGATVALGESGNISGPASLSIPLGSTSGTFVATASQFTFDQSATITASLNGVTQSAALSMVAPLLISSLQCTSPTMVSNASNSCTVTLTKSAPAGGAVVALSGGIANVLGLPASITVPANTASAAFTVNTGVVSLNQNATITASFNGSSQAAPLSLTTLVSLSSLQCAPSTLASNATTTCTVALTQPAPPGGLPVTLSGAIAGILSLPPSVTVPANAAGVTFKATAGSIASNQIVTIVASLNTSSQQVDLSLNAPVLLSDVQCTVAALGSNASTSCTVTLTGAAPPGGLVVSISGTIAKVFNLPASVTVPPNASTATFTVNTGSIPSNLTAGITAAVTVGTVRQTAATWIQLTTSAVVAALQCAPVSVNGGSSSTCTVTLSGAAPTGGAAVSISGNNAAVTVPASVTIAAGATSASFAAATTAVTTSQTVVITASYGGTSPTASLTVTPSAIFSLQCTPASVTGGSPTTCTVTLSAAAPVGGAAVSISDNSAAVSAPASVTIAAGVATASFQATTTAVTASQTAVITATYGGTPQTASLTVAPPTVSSVQCNPALVTGGSPSTCTVTLSGAAPAAGAVVSISDNSAAATAPTSLTIAAGATSNTFVVTTTAVATNQTVSLSASYGGASPTASLAISAPAPASLVCSPATINAGSASTCTVWLGSSAPTAGFAVTLSSNNPNLTVPARVTVLSGSLTAIFSASAASITADQSAVVTASANGASQPASVFLSAPAQLTSMSCAPVKVASGSSAICTVTLSKTAPASTAVVALSGGNAVLSIPANVTVAAGASSATFTATASGTTTQVVALTALWNGITVPFSITVTPPPPTFSILGSSAEVSGVTNGSTITPTIAPAGLTGTVVVNGAGSMSFAPNQNGNGVYFLGCCQNNNNAYYKFAGTAVGNIFNFNQGQVAFSLTSRYSIGQRSQAASYRSVLDVRDGSASNHLVSFTTQVSSGSLIFYYNVGSQQQFYVVPRGTENALFGSGVTMQVIMTWSGHTVSLYLNGNLVKSTPYTPPATNWTASSVFDLGAYEYLGYNGYDSCDDVISEFSVGPIIQP